MIISRTPFRISFFGGGTDYPVWYQEHGGAVLTTAIDKYCYLSCRRLPPFFDHKSRISYSKIEAVASHADIEHPSARAVLQYLDVTEGVEIHHDGDLPARTGLGSSSAFTVGLLHALLALRQVMPTKQRLAQEAIHIEQTVLQENVGCQDQVAVAFGGLNRIRFSPDHQFDVTPVIVGRDRLKALQSHLLLYFTGFSRTASLIAREQIKQTRHKTRELTSMFQMVDEATTLLTGTGDIGRFGQLLDESWKMKRSLSSRITTKAIDDIYGTAREAGALGGKLLGAGGGGFMLFFARPEDHLRIRERLKHLLHVPFRFETHGSQIIFYQEDALGDDSNGPWTDSGHPSLTDPAVSPVEHYDYESTYI